jgi:D-alanine--poly(phosphoribitol) ligase subunit 2
MTPPVSIGPTGTRVLELLRDVTGDDEVLTDLDVALFDSALLDSLGVVTLLVSLEETFGLTIAPTDLDREAWATPRRLVADVVSRLAAEGAA